MVREDTAKEFCDQRNLPFFTTSALTGEGVETLFSILGTMIDEKRAAR
jgi:hypothetical protein